MMIRLWRAIRVLRHHGITVTYQEGAGPAALFNAGDLRRVGLYEVIRRADALPAAIVDDVDTSMIPLRAWPDLSPNAFR